MQCLPHLHFISLMLGFHLTLLARLHLCIYSFYTLSEHLTHTVSHELQIRVLWIMCLSVERALVVHLLCFRVCHWDLYNALSAFCKNALET